MAFTQHNFSENDLEFYGRPSDAELKRLALQQIEQTAPGVFSGVKIRIRRNGKRRELEVSAYGTYGYSYPDLIQNVRRSILSRMGYAISAVNFVLKGLENPDRFPRIPA